GAGLASETPCRSQRCKPRDRRALRIRLPYAKRRAERLGGRAERPRRQVPPAPRRARGRSATRKREKSSCVQRPVPTNRRPHSALLATPLFTRRSRPPGLCDPRDESAAVSLVPAAQRLVQVEAAALPLVIRVPDAQHETPSALRPVPGCAASEPRFKPIGVPRAHAVRTAQRRKAQRQRRHSQAVPLVRIVVDHGSFSPSLSVLSSSSSPSECSSVITSAACARPSIAPLSALTSKSSSTARTTWRALLPLARALRRA